MGNICGVDEDTWFGIGMAVSFMPPIDCIKSSCVTAIYCCMCAARVCNCLACKPIEIKTRLKYGYISEVPCCNVYSDCCRALYHMVVCPFCIPIMVPACICGAMCLCACGVYYAAEKCGYCSKKYCCCCGNSYCRDYCDCCCDDDNCCDNCCYRFCGRNCRDYFCCCCGDDNCCDNCCSCSCDDCCKKHNPPIRPSPPIQEQPRSLLHM